MPKPRSWTDDDLRAAAAASLSLTQVLLALGFAKTSGSRIPIRARIEELGLDTSHWGVCSRERTQRAVRHPAKPRRTWSDEDLRRAVSQSRSIAQVLGALGLKVGGGTYVAIQRRIAALELDTSHFKGKGWSKGLKNPVPQRKRPLSEILVRDSTYTYTNGLRLRLLKEGLKEYRCEVCGREEWNGKPIPLQLDHINGDRTDHRLENLRIVCPNCHAQTDTWCGKNVGRVGSGG